jgi:hypothetical protein
MTRRQANGHNYFMTKRCDVFDDHRTHKPDLLTSKTTSRNNTIAMPP